MPVFLHQNEFIEELKYNETYVTNAAVLHTSSLTEDNFTNVLETKVKDAASRVKETYKTKKKGRLPKIKFKQVFKDIFESSVVGGKERHERMMRKLGKDPGLSESLIHENSRVGALFASKAFVQLAVNPIVGMATQRLGYQIPFLLGTVILFVSASGKTNLPTTFAYSNNINKNTF